MITLFFFFFTLNFDFVSLPKMNMLYDFVIMSGKLVCLFSEWFLFNKPNDDFPTLILFSYCLVNLGSLESIFVSLYIETFLDSNNQAVLTLFVPEGYHQQYLSLNNQIIENVPVFKTFFDALNTFKFLLLISFVI